VRVQRLLLQRPLNLQIVLSTLLTKIENRRVAQHRTSGKTYIPQDGHDSVTPFGGSDKIPGVTAVLFIHKV
jgi:hypothetical protein